MIAGGTWVGWSEEEDNIVRADYQKIGAKAVARKLEGRTAGAVRIRYFRLKLADKHQILKHNCPHTVLRRM